MFAARTKRLTLMQVMRLESVANKLLRKPVGTDALLEGANFDELINPIEPQKDQIDTRKYNWLLLSPRFQEIVPLNAKNVLGPERRRILARWNSLVSRTLNRSVSTLKGRKEAKAGERQKVHPVKDGSSDEGSAPDFRCIISKRMVGVVVSVWVRHDLQYHIRHPSVSRIGCGIMGCLGNKVRHVTLDLSMEILDSIHEVLKSRDLDYVGVQGSVSVRFWLHETSFCFVCCHLASGGKEGDELKRNSDAMEILWRTSFPGGHPLRLPQKILDHDSKRRSPMAGCSKIGRKVPSHSAPPTNTTPTPTNTMDACKAGKARKGELRRGESQHNLLRVFS
ncbi:hypothetical protein GW17_00011101 [Ensete ventricosum]|nr:hypothetical protein GW17_00011101 [Ensete ventricosum]